MSVDKPLSRKLATNTNGYAVTMITQNAMSDIDNFLRKLHIRESCPRQHV